MQSFPKVYFSPMSSNRKLAKLEAKYGKGYTFSTLSGYTCPHSKDCHSKAVPTLEGGWKIVDGPHTQFRCFSASQEVIFPAVREQRLANMALHELAAQKNGASLVFNALNAQLPEDCKIMRIHVGGDFNTQPFFDAWTVLASVHTDVIFYAYTKCLPFWIKRKDSIPANFRLTASFGGYKDELIAKHNLRYAKVVYSVAEAESLNLEIDEDDSHAVENGPSFGLLIHGSQPKHSAAGEALKKLNKAKKLEKAGV